MKDIKDYEKEQKAIVVYYQKGKSLVKRKAEKMSIVGTNISGKMCIPFIESNKSIEKHGGKDGSLNQY